MLVANPETMLLFVGKWYISYSLKMFTDLKFCTKKICYVLNTAINKTKAFAANRLHSNNARKIWSEGNFISFILSNIKSKRKFKNCKCYRLGGRHSNLNKYIQRHNEYFWSREQITICKPILFSIVCLIPVGNKQYATQ